MSFLAQARTGASTRPKIIMLYGVAGIGKSTEASRLPNGVFLPTEDNVDHISNATVLPLARDFGQVMTMLQELAEAEHSFENLTVDSISSLGRLIDAQVCVENNVTQIDKIPYGNGKNLAMEYWTHFWNMIAWIRDNRNMNVILISHPEIKKVPNPNGESYDGYKPQLNDKAMEMLRQNCNGVFFADFEVMVRSTDKGFGQKEHKGVGNGNRVMYTQSRPTHVAKCAVSLPEKMSFDLVEALSEWNKIVTA